MKNVQTIQLSAKVFKAQKILAVILGLVAIGVMSLSDAVGAGAITLALAFIWFYTANTLTWWYHA